jgi:hypothetical protein|tara:strand:+ start:572 stop:943 length:372 start_codon:yes stop_codon:yes gene_type:complete
VFGTIGQIASSITSLATSYIDGKTAVQKAEAQIRMKEATGDIDWDLASIRATQGSWKDEWILLLFSIPLILAFTGDTGRQIVADGFSALETMPQWYQISLGAIISASVGQKAVGKFFNMKKKK